MMTKIESFDDQQSGFSQSECKNFESLRSFAMITRITVIEKGKGFCLVKVGLDAG